MLSHYSDWDNGHTPVTTGRAPWLTLPFIQAMHETRNAISRENELARERHKAKSNGGR